MTNRGLIGNKYDPFIFQYILPAGRLCDAASIDHLEGVWNIRPEYDSIIEVCSKKRKMKYLPNTELRNNIVETLTSKYQLETVIEDENNADVILGAHGASVNTFAIAELKKIRKESLVLVKIITTGSEKLTLEVFTQSGHSTKVWNSKQSSIAHKGRDVLRATGVCVKKEDDNLILTHTPMAIVKLAQSNAGV